jgi:hypothetical protein
VSPIVEAFDDLSLLGLIGGSLLISSVVDSGSSSSNRLSLISTLQDRITASASLSYRR